MKTDKLLQLIQQKKVMRSGGALPLPKAQDGNKGEYLPIDPYSGLPVKNLKGVEVVGQKDYGSYIDQLRKDWANTYNEHPVMSAIPGTNALLTLGNVLSTPQKSLMYALTGRYDTPSNIHPTRGLGNFQNKAVDVMQDIAFDPLMFLGAVPEAKAAINASKESGVLSNAYKYNPWRFKPNPEAYYHRSPNLEHVINQEKGTLQGFGQSEAGKLFSQTKEYYPGTKLNLRKPAKSELYYSKGTPLDWGRTNMILDEKTGKMIPGQGYEGPYLVEVTNVPFVAKANGSFTKVFNPETGQFVRGVLPPTGIGRYAVAKRPVFLDEAKFYKEDWLRGYKEIPKKEGGGSLPKAQDGTITDPYIGMRKFYDDAYAALDKYENKQGEVSPFNVSRAWAKAAIKNPYLLFRDRHNLAEQGFSEDQIMSAAENPYHKESPVIRISDTETRYQHPTDYVIPNEKDIERYNRYLTNKSQQKSSRGNGFDLSDEWKDIKRGVRNVSRDVRHFIGKEVPRALRNCVNGNCYEFHQKGGPLPKHQGTDKSETGYHFPLWAIRNPALLLSGFLGSDKENTQPEPVVEKPTRAPFNYDLYNDRASAYLSRPVFEGTPLTGQLIADSARDFYNQTGYEYPLDLLLSQAQFETSMGRKLKSKNNFFNVGNYDDGRTLDYKTPQDSLSAYMNLIYNDYLNKGKVPADQLLQPGKFVNTQGKRYASNPDYEKNLANQSSVIKKTWAEKINKKKNAEKAFGGHIASYQSLGETNEDNNKPPANNQPPVEIKNYVSVPPYTIFPDKAWTMDINDPNTGYTFNAQQSIPQIFSTGVTALNPKKSTWTQQDLGSNTEGIVEKLELTGDSLGPNIFRETGTACRKPNGDIVPECASGVQLAIDYATDIGAENRKRLGMKGDAWTMGQNVVDAGGSRYYNLLGEGFDKSTLHSNKQVKNYLDDRREQLGIKPLDIYNSAQPGDLVEMWYENSPSQHKALSRGKGAVTTHIGIVSVKDGKKYITHNVHGHWESTPLEKAIRNKSKLRHGTSVMVSGLVRPDYMDNSQALETVGIQVNPEARVYSGSSEETKRNPEETKWKTKTPLGRQSQIFTRNLAYYAPQIQQDFGFSDSEMEELIRTSFGIFGKESGFGEGAPFKKRQLNRKFIRKYKDIMPDWFYEGDEMSEGKGQMKLNELFNTPEKKALLEKYGINKDNIWDTGNSAAAVLLTTAMNYKNLSSLIGTTFDNTDGLTLKNVLALTHSKGLDAVLNNEFISEKGDKRNVGEKFLHLLKGEKDWNRKWDEAPQMDMSSILKGLETYSTRHLDSGSYANIFEDYAASLNIDYNKVKENFVNKENFQTRTESIPGTIVDAATEGINNVVTGAENEINSGVDQAERLARKAARGPKKVISKIKKELRRTPLFQEGGFEVGGPTPTKAAQMLKDNSAHGQPLTDAQKRYFHLLINQKNKK